MGPLRVVEDAVVSASRAAGLRHHVHMPYSEPPGQGVSQSRQELARRPAQLWMVPPLPAQLGPSLSGLRRAGPSLHKEIWVPTVAVPGPLHVAPMAERRRRATPHTQRAWAHPQPWLLGARGAQRDPSSAHTSSRVHLSVPPRGETQTVPLNAPRIFPRDNRQEPLCAGDRPTPTPECVVVGGWGALTQQGTHPRMCCSWGVGSLTQQGVPRGRGPDSMPGTQTGSQKAGSSVDRGQVSWRWCREGLGSPAGPASWCVTWSCWVQCSAKLCLQGWGTREAGYAGAATSA